MDLRVVVDEMVQARLANPYGTRRTDWWPSEPGWYVVEEHGEVLVLEFVRNTVGDAELSARRGYGYVDSQRLAKFTAIYDRPLELPEVKP